jgi:hypothetical protein
LSVQSSTQQGAKKPYQLLDVAFKNLTFGNKVEGKKLLPFGAQGDTFQIIASAANGDVFEIEVVKNDKGFNDWVKATRITEGAEVSESGEQASTSGNSAGVSHPAARSNYETAEERANRQVLIVRQSSLTNAINTLTVGTKSALSPNDVLALADQYVNYVLNSPATSDELPAEVQ